MPTVQEGRIGGRHVPKRPVVTVPRQLGVMAGHSLALDAHIAICVTEIASEEASTAPPTHAPGFRPNKRVLRPSGSKNDALKETLVSARQHDKVENGPGSEIRPDARRLSVVQRTVLHVIGSGASVARCQFFKKNLGAKLARALNAALHSPLCPVVLQDHDLCLHNPLACLESRYGRLEGAKIEN